MVNVQKCHAFLEVGCDEYNLGYQRIIMFVTWINQYIAIAERNKEYLGHIMLYK